MAGIAAPTPSDARQQVEATHHPDIRHQRIGGLAALYLAIAFLAAMPYFLLVVDYPGATTASEKVTLIVDNYASIYAMYLATYAVFGLALGLLASALWQRLHGRAPVAARIATGIGLVWAVLLVASGLVFTHGMTIIRDMAATSPADAALTWQAVEPVALGLGGAGGELLGGLWVMIVSVAIVRSGALPSGLGWLGIAIGAAGLASVVPPLHDAAIAFGLLLIVWFTWLGVVLVRTRVTSGSDGAGTADAHRVVVPGSRASGRP